MPCTNLAFSVNRMPRTFYSRYSPRGPWRRNLSIVLAGSARQFGWLVGWLIWGADILSLRQFSLQLGYHSMLVRNLTVVVWGVLEFLTPVLVSCLFSPFAPPKKAFSLLALVVYTVHLWVPPKVQRVISCVRTNPSVPMIPRGHIRKKRCVKLPAGMGSCVRGKAMVKPLTDCLKSKHWMYIM